MQNRNNLIPHLSHALVILLFFMSCESKGEEPTRASPTVKGLSELIKVPGVYADLDLVDGQKEKIDKALADQRSISRDFGARFGQASPAERSEMALAFKVANTKLETEISATLLPHQLERLSQIRMNIIAANDGATFGLKNREFLEFLELTDAQKAEIEKKSAEINKLVEDKVKKLTAEIEKVKLEARDDLIKLLTPEQRKKYLDRVGRPFEVDRRKYGRGQEK